MNNIKSYLTIVLCMAIFWSFISHMGLYWENYLECEENFVSAKKFIQTEVCKDPIVRAELKKFDYCDNLEKITKTAPWACAALATASDLKLCANDSCYLFAINVTDQLPKIIVFSIITLFLLLWASSKQIGINNQERMVQYYSLPGIQKIKDR